MMTIRPSQERGHFDHGWLDTYHSFSFNRYHDPAHMGFRSLRVLNEDRVQSGQGFGTHPHRDMEIITCVLAGALEHKDSMGNGSVIRVGDVQRLSAGTGITHSEFNASDDEPVHLLQIWIIPEREGITPGYEQQAVPRAERRGRLALLAAPDGANGAVTINQDASLLSTILDPGEEVSHILNRDRYAWVQVAAGDIVVNGQSLGQGDGAAISGEEEVRIRSVTQAEVFLFDLA